MFTRSVLCTTAICLSLTSPLAFQATALARDSSAAATYKKLTDSVGPSLVTVKFVMKFEGGGDMFGGESGRDVEVTGLMIEAGGLVLVSNVNMGGMASRMGVTANPTDIKVLIGDDTEGLKGRLLARDSELDLCWIQIDDDKAKGKSFAFVDFSKGAGAAVGEKLYAVNRMGKFFDHALSVDEGRVAGMTRKPRALLIPGSFGGDQRSQLGMPLFTGDGAVVGVNILQLPDKEDMEGGDMGPGSFAILTLPAAEVVKATSRGKEMAAKAPPTPAKPAETDTKPESEKKAEGSPPAEAPKTEPKKD